jgi:hypothetical protein
VNELPRINSYYVNFNQYGNGFSFSVGPCRFRSVRVAHAQHRLLEQYANFSRPEMSICKFSTRSPIPVSVSSEECSAHLWVCDCFRNSPSQKMRCEYFFIFLLGRIVVVFCFSFMDYMQELEAERAEEEREFEAIDRALEEAGSEDDDLEEGGQHREPGSAVGTPAEHLQQQE